MPQLIISDKARADIVRFHAFLKQQDVTAANNAVFTLLNAFGVLGGQPHIGRLVEDEPDLREFLVEFGNSGYVALYRYDSKRDAVVVLTIRHQREVGYQ
ncbi:type II toxin-antitoxin system RelE/ParE family toxin [Candidatus Thiothrix anitrata]|jgi:plasmid stabilization system protein ParE|uniref:Type II toxin-antitoxin system RelE/ParE family toxin n=1 Tax=Candidatus Thiothrix anitrata TaxID=2823902 RepID=A0ABX7WZ37_9GAMM|nr:type II toxin-antitoxin system RelE/ParE family toxin [Candidatus Thiothrix anitrata]QTR48934.1 type II toxin-antitoxin system RelE/ParE family toxin [Candidatus Thiothrix anitrata]